jgi:hypothetical protein
MFRTPASVALKEDTRIKGRDIKKLRGDIATQFALSEDAINALMPAKVWSGVWGGGAGRAWRLLFRRHYCAPTCAHALTS